MSVEIGSVITIKGLYRYKDIEHKYLTIKQNSNGTLTLIDSNYEKITKVSSLSELHETISNLVNNKIEI